jgi:hypothetical protein
MAAEAAGETVSHRPACLTLLLLLAACRGDADHARSPSTDTIAPIGTGTELLLTRERLDLIEDWIRAAIARDGTPPASLDAVRPPDADAARYVPLDRFLRDGWGREIAYDYTPQTHTYELRSLGADGVPNTADDVVARAR